MRGARPDAGGRPAETLTLTCGHRLTNCIVRHPLVLPGSSIRCPNCTVPCMVLRVESSPTASGRSGWAHDETAPRRKILVFDDAESL